MYEPAGGEADNRGGRATGGVGGGGRRTGRGRGWGGEYIEGRKGEWKDGHEGKESSCGSHLDVHLALFIAHPLNGLL